MKDPKESLVQVWSVSSRGARETGYRTMRGKERYPGALHELHTVLLESMWERRRFRCYERCQ